MTQRRFHIFYLKKDKIPASSRSNIIYEFTCPGCHISYIVNTERTLFTRRSKHPDALKSLISKHLSKCENANFIPQSNRLFDNLNDTHDSDAYETDSQLSFHHLIEVSTQILHSLKHNNSNLLLFLKALYILNIESE